ncbi:MAG: tetratricopeptide repeat protein [Planctomycetota bacterium]
MADTLVSSAEQLIEHEEFQQARELLENAIALYQQTADAEPNLLVEALHAKGRVCLRIAHYDEAESSLREAVELSQQLFGVESVETAAVLASLGELRQTLAKFEEAELLLDKALSIREALLGKSHPETASSVTLMGSLMLEKGDLPGAERMLRNALASYRENALGSSLPAAKAMTQLGRVLWIKGDYTAEELLLQEAMDITRSQRGEDSLATAEVLIPYAACLIRTRNYEKSEAFIRRALDIRRRKLDPKHPLIAHDLNFLALILRIREDYAMAGPTFDEALCLYREALGDNHPHVAGCMRDMGQLLRRVGRTDEAIDLFHHAIRVFRSTYGDYDLRVADALHSLSYVYRTREDWESAEPLLREALAITEFHRSQVLGGSRARAVFSFSNRMHDYSDALSRALASQGRLEEAIKVHEQGRSRTRLDLLFNPHDDESAQSSSTKFEGSRGLEETKQRKKQAEQAVAAFEDAMAQDLRRADLTVPARREQFPRRLSELTRKREELRFAEADVLAHETAAWKDVKSADLQDIRSVMRPGELLLIYRWSYLDVILFVVSAAGEGVVESYLLVKTENNNKRLHGPKMKVLEGTVSVGAVNERKERFEALAELRRELLPEPVAKAAMEASVLIVVPDGILRELPIEMLFAAETAPVAVDEGEPFAKGAFPPVVYAESASLFVLHRRRGTVGPTIVNAHPLTALVLADPVFEGMQEEDASSSATDSRADSAWDSANPISSRVDELRFLGGTLRPLPETATEAMKVADIIHRVSGSATVLMRGQASLTQLEKNAPGKQLIHMATHGFAGSSARPFDVGLALTWPGISSDQQSGFLTLERLLDHWRGTLKGCDLVTLSACETNCGRSFGDNNWMTLSSGFLYAGARSVVASLWQVDETATRLLMQRFYENLLGDYSEPRGRFRPGSRMPKVHALHEAKLWLRSRGAHDAEFVASRGGLAESALELRQPKESDTLSHPYYWASCVLVGEPE